MTYLRPYIYDLIYETGLRCPCPKGLNIHEVAMIKWYAKNSILWASDGSAIVTIMRSP